MINTTVTIDNFSKENTLQQIVGNQINDIQTYGMEQLSLQVSNKQ
jgi:hypothetical protein